MLGLVQPNASSAGQGDPGDASPAFLIEWPGDGDLSPLQFLCRRLDVLAQQVELVIVLLLGRVDRKLCGRKREDEPTAARIHGVKPEYVSKERAVRLGIAAVDKNVRARNHRLHAASLATRSAGSYSVGLEPGDLRGLHHPNWDIEVLPGVDHGLFENPNGLEPDQAKATRLATGVRDLLAGWLARTVGVSP